MFRGLFEGVSEPDERRFAERRPGERDRRRTLVDDLGGWQESPGRTAMPERAIWLQAPEY